MTKFFSNFLKIPILGLIRLYQLSVSPDHGWLFRGRYPHGYCRHYPSCSEYTRQAVLKYGAMRGLVLGAVRILKCNPFTQPSVDLLK